MKETKTAIYMGACSWGSNKISSLSLPEQTQICREYMKNHPELKKVGTYTDRNTLRDSTKELDRLLVELENRRVDCIVVASIYHFFESSSIIAFYVKQVVVPAGLRLIAIREEIDTENEDWHHKFDVCIRKRGQGNGKSQ